MPSTTTYSFADVVLVSFPFTDQRATKKRPAVVISSDTYHRQRPDIILMAITSQVRPTTTVGEAVIQHWKRAGLIKPSVLKPLIATVEHRLILRKMGNLYDDDLVALRNALTEVLG